MTDDVGSARPADTPGGFTPPPVPPVSGQVPPIESVLGQGAGQEASPAPYGGAAYGGSGNPPQGAYGQQNTYGQQAWTPAPKPGLVPLRPLGFGTLLGAPFAVLRRNPKASLGSALLIQLVVMVVTVGLLAVVSVFALSRIAFADADDRATVSAGSIALIGVSALVAAAVSLLGTALLQALLVIEVSREILGEKRTFGFLWKTAWRRFGPLLGFFLLILLVFALIVALFVGIIAAAAAVGGTGAVAVSVLVSVLLGLGLVVLFIWIGVKLALVPCAIVLERASLRASVARSWRLTDGSFWKTFGVLALVILIVSFASQVVTTPISLLFGVSTAFIDPNQTSTTTPTGLIVLLVIVYVVTGIISLIFGAISSVVQAGATVLIYVDLRMRKEGLDLELVRYVEAGGTASTLPDPFDPVPSR